MSHQPPTLPRPVEASGDARKALAADQFHVVSRLRFIGIIEGATLVLLLLVAMPLKYFANQPMAVSILGPIHGLVFMTYGWAVAMSLSVTDWPRGHAIRLAIAAFLPLGPFFNESLLKGRMAALAKSAELS